MQTELAEDIRATPQGRIADAILRKCVHCGFCTAVCPTYQLLGDERDGPRGRIYLIKQVLEGQAVTQRTQLHLDRCLTCRACESACPSGVEYARLLEIGRAEVARRVPRPAGQRAVRWVLRNGLTSTVWLRPMVRFGRAVRPLLPESLAHSLQPASTPAGWPPVRHRRRFAVLQGCVQDVMQPAINAAAARVLDAVGISLVAVAGAGCCGALPAHLDDRTAAETAARRNIDAWWPYLDRSEFEGVVFTATGCGVQLKDYAALLAEDARYAEPARRISTLCRDISELVAAQQDTLMRVLASQPSPTPLPRVAVHAPCTLQHGLRLHGVVEGLLRAAGFELVATAPGLACCGSAGSYSVLQPQLSAQLRSRKLADLMENQPQVIASANIGCILHLNQSDGPSVRHWIELLDQRMTATNTAESGTVCCEV
jgi:glycolate oxidase iron-sulfur subunit